MLLRVQAFYMWVALLSYGKGMGVETDGSGPPHYNRINVPWGDQSSRTPVSSHKGNSILPFLGFPVVPVVKTQHTWQEVQDLVCLQVSGGSWSSSQLNYSYWKICWTEGLWKNYLLELAGDDSSGSRPFFVFLVFLSGFLQAFK